jgi:DnaJ-class molecular chaperone
MATITQCKECHGTGKVVFTKERGGPVCPHCGGHGWVTPDLLVKYFAGMLDHPSVYMGGPSQGNLKRAKRLVEFLQDEGIMPSDSELNTPPKT